LTIDFSIDKIYSEALQKEKLIPVAQGKISEITSQSPLIIKIEVEILPEVELDDKYKKISLKRQKVEVTDIELEAALTDIQTRFTVFKEVDVNAKVEK
jgi:FKBP-type peptidyl-prolyl cis-trans isomerase (trigger factor)